MVKYKVALRGGFSDRNQIKPENTTIQTNSLDERTRVALCNATSIVVCDGVLYNNHLADSKQQKFIKHLHLNFSALFKKLLKRKLLPFTQEAHMGLQNFMHIG